MTNYIKEIFPPLMEDKDWEQDIKQEIYLSCLEEERLDRLTDLDN